MCASAGCSHRLDTISSGNATALWNEVAPINVVRSDGCMDGRQAVKRTYDTPNESMVWVILHPSSKLISDRVSIEMELPNPNTTDDGITMNVDTYVSGRISPQPSTVSTHASTVSTRFHSKHTRFQ